LLGRRGGFSVFFLVGRNILRLYDLIVFASIAYFHARRFALALPIGETLAGFPKPLPASDAGGAIEASASCLCYARALIFDH
jgi:hypothetical protein